MTLKKETEDTNKWKDLSCSWIGKISIVKMSTLPKAIYRFNASPIRFSKALFTDRKKILNFVLELQYIGNSKSNPEKE